MGTWESQRRWILACAVAETTGMAASAAAAGIGRQVADGGGRWLALAVVVGGGLVEGIALGSLQGRVLAGRWPALGRLRFALLTVLVAGIGWAVASAPGVLGGDDAGSAGPPLGLMVPGALGLGLVMGAVLGAVQARSLRGVVAHPSRWVLANAAAWPPAMLVIFIGASAAGDWPVLALAGYGALTGAVAGAALGLVSGWWLESLDGQPLANRVAVALLEARWFGLERGLVALAVRGRRTGRVLRFPVQYAVWGDDLVVVPGHADHKSWWRNLEGRDVPVEVLRQGRWIEARAQVVTAGDPGYESANDAYRARWRHSEPGPWEPVVVLHGVGAGIAGRSRGLKSVR